MFRVRMRIDGSSAMPCGFGMRVGRSETKFRAIPISRRRSVPGTSITFLTRAGSWKALIEFLPGCLTTETRRHREIGYAIMKATVIVTLKPTVLDPQGMTIHRSLASLGLTDITDV